MTYETDFDSGGGTDIGRIAAEDIPLAGRCGPAVSAGGPEVLPQRRAAGRHARQGISDQMNVTEQLLDAMTPFMDGWMVSSLHYAHIIFWILASLSFSMAMIRAAREHETLRSAIFSLAWTVIGISIML